MRREVEIDMKFQVINAEGNCVMTTNYSSCIPYDDLDHMAKAGYRFKIDGKTVARKHIESSIKSYVKSSDMSRDTINSASIVHTSSSNRQVRCIGTGIIYKNQSAAARDLGIDPAQVSDSIKTGRPRSGYRFEKVI